MSRTSDSENVWGPYIVEIQLELDNLNHKLKEVVEGPYISRSPRRINTASTPRRHQMTFNDQFSSTTGRMPSPAVRKKPLVNKDREVITNYLQFPARPNASARIFKPHKLKYPTYSYDKKVVPILRGGQKNNTLPN